MPIAGDGSDSIALAERILAILDRGLGEQAVIVFFAHPDVELGVEELHACSPVHRLTDVHAGADRE